MSQKVLFGQDAIAALLEEKGGIATLAELVRLAEDHYPTTSLPKRTGEYLQRMRKWAVVRYEKGYYYFSTMDSAHVQAEIALRNRPTNARPLPRRNAFS